MINTQKIKLWLIAAVLTLTAIVPVLATSSAGAQISPESKQAACDGLSGASGQGCEPCTGNAPCPGTASTTIGRLLARVVSILSWIVGIAGIIMVIVGGFKLVTSSGDSNKIASARSTIIYALIGLAVAVAAQFLVNFVIKESRDATNNTSATTSFNTKVLG